MSAPSSGASFFKSWFTSPKPPPPRQIQAVAAPTPSSLGSRQVTILNTSPWNVAIKLFVQLGSLQAAQYVFDAKILAAWDPNGWDSDSDSPPSAHLLEIPSATIKIPVNEDSKIVAKLEVRYDLRSCSTPASVLTESAQADDDEGPVYKPNYSLTDRDNTALQSEIFSLSNTTDPLRFSIDGYTLPIFMEELCNHVTPEEVIANSLQLDRCDRVS